MRALLVLMLAAAPAVAQKQFGFDNTKSSGQDYLSPAETVKRMTVPPEFEVKLFAGEPDCINPVAFTIDERGRVWVLECFEYPSRTPPGKAPRDRIVILEDTDGDGVADKRTVFCEGKDFPVSEERRKAGLGAFDLATGLEVGNGGVYVGAAPYLFFIENKDDKPGKFTTLLSGFGSQDTHETLNTFQWGPDGWLYGCHGIYTQSKVKSADAEVNMNAAVWRYHPKTKKFEIFAEGTSNPWGLDWRNTDGQFILACCVIPHLYHIVPGGVYKRQGGTSSNPYAYGFINEICDHTFHKESGWAHAGLISLDAPHIPQKYRDSVIFGSIHGCSLKRNVLKPNGSSFTASRADDFLTSGDKNVRPINLRWGPHGDIYLIDWHDKNPCHQAAAGSWDYERGRVYRIQLKDTQCGKPFDLARWSDHELNQLVQSFQAGDYKDPKADAERQSARAKYLEGRGPGRFNVPTPYWKRTATRLLQERRGGFDDRLKHDVRFSLWYGEGDEEAQIKRLEADIYDESRQESTRRGMAKDYSGRWRAQIVRALAENPSVSAGGVARLTALAGTEKAVNVRRELAAAAVRLAPQHDVAPLLHGLMKHAEDAADPLIPQLVWLVYEKVVTKNAAAELAFLAEQSPNNISVRDAIVPKVMRRLAATGKAENLALCLKFIADVKDTASRERALDGLVTAYQGQTIDAPPAWATVQQELRQDVKLAPLVKKLAVSFRDPAALQQAADDVSFGRTTETRIEGLRNLVLLKHPDAAKTVQIELEKEPNAAVRLEAARQVANLTEPAVGAAVVRNWEAYPKEIQAELVRSLAGRKEWAKALLTAMADKKIDRTALTDNTVLKMQGFKDKEIDALIEKAWGRARPTPADLVKLIDATRDKLDETPASFARGKAVFEAQCMKCHKFDGKGVEVGPPLDGAGRDIEYIMANVIDPNRVIGAPYFLRTLNTLDGRIEQGLLAEEDDASITLKVENAQLKKFQKKDLDGPVKVQEKSMMPEGLTAAMTPQNFRDLIRYVMAHPFLTDVTVNGQLVAAGVTGRIPLPMAKEISVVAEFTAADAVKTKLLVGSMNGFTVTLDGQLLGKGDGTGKAAKPDTDGIEVELSKGKHTLTVITSNNAAGGGVYLRLLDPDRKLSYPEK